MINSLLPIPADKRKIILKNLKHDTAKNIFNNIYTLTEELGLDKIPDYETRVKMRSEHIQKFPDVVFWDYAEYANTNQIRKHIVIDDIEQYFNCKVSTNGDIVILNKMNKLRISTNDISHRYPTIHLEKDKEKFIHRIVASTFIHKDERLKDKSHKHLEVNHKDGTRWNRVIGNLEWVTCKENVRHGVGDEDYTGKKYFQFEVTVDNGYLGEKFILSEDDLHLLGFSFSELKARSISSKFNCVTKLKTTLLRENDIQDKTIGIPEGILELYKKNVNYFNPDFKPYIGTVKDGKYKGFTFSLFGGTEVAKYFDRSTVSGIARGIYSRHKGCDFRHCSHKEAIPLHGKLTEEIANSINNYTFG